MGRTTSSICRRLEAWNTLNGRMILSKVPSGKSRAKVGRLLGSGKGDASTSSLAHKAEASKANRRLPSVHFKKSLQQRKGLSRNSLRGRKKKNL
ncbi:unnamed protein product [Urochloa humidicola]